MLVKAMMEMMTMIYTAVLKDQTVNNK